MPKNLVKSVNARIDEILTARVNEIKECETALDEAETAVSVARNAMLNATNAIDVDAYNSAADDLKQAEMAISVYSTRLSQLREKRHVTVEEDQATMATIREMQNTLRVKATADIVNLMGQIETIGHKYFDEQNAVNQLAARWHNEVCPQKHPRIPELTVDAYDLKAEDGALREIIRKIVKDNFYRREVGIAQYRGIGSMWTK